MDSVSTKDTIIFFSNHLRSEDDAYNLYRGLYAAELKNSLENLNLEYFFFLEALGISKIIKRFETQKHYNRCFKIFDNILDDFFKKNTSYIKVSKSNKNRIAFLIHNTEGFLAHHEVFFYFLENIDREKFLKFTIDIFTQTPLDRINPKISQFCKIFNLKIFSFTSESLYSFYNKVIKFYVENNYKNLIFLSVVEGMSFISKSLPGNVSWFSLKHLADSFKNLKHIYAYSQEVKLNLADNTKIFYYKNFAKLDVQTINCNFKSKKNKFYTINREEKIKNSIFLNCVKEILYEFPQSTFSWTGKVKDQFIENFFRQHNLSDRVIFLGWINIDEFGLKHGDIFLDVPDLSGLVAAKCFSAGIPTVFFNNSPFWLNEFQEEVKIYNLYNSIEKEIVSDWYNNINNYKNNYLNITKKLVTNENYFKNYINLSVKLANKYFLGNKKEADILLENIFS